MKNFITLFIILIGFSQVSFSQQEKGIIGSSNWLENWTNFKPNKVDYGEPTQILTGNIETNTTLYKREVYLLSGHVFVTNNSKLTIEPGTVILCDFKTKASLTITKGSKIIAEGRETDPIIFTSNRSVKRPGDWGGLVLLGDSFVNRYGLGSVANFYKGLEPKDYANTNYGGENDEEGSSGILKFVRIEYAGNRVDESNYFNGLFLVGVGRKTKLNSVMISFAANDAVSVWGGRLNMTKMVSYKSQGSDFVFNYGVKGLLRNSISIRSPYASNGIDSKSLKVKSYDKKDEFDFSKRSTAIRAENITLINQSDDLKADIERNLVKEAVYVGQNTKMKITKSVISGFNPAVVLDKNIKVNQQSLSKIQFEEMYFNNCNGNIFVEHNANNDDLENWYGNASFFNVYSKGDDAETFIAASNFKKPDYRLRINKIIATNIDREKIDE